MILGLKSTATLFLLSFINKGRDLSLTNQNSDSTLLDATFLTMF